jgi:UDP-N-acetylglucosamine--N-acetylmuramyl-(pentapeptide) pyrophosphoryl-undecaprenol N-acetylglucosamine transferase
LKQQSEHIKVLISGGGTGGHIFPAISIADEIKRRLPDSKILFVGARDRMEMEKVPAAGYKIIGLPVSGFQRKLTLKNFTVLWNLLRSVIMARRIIFDFKPTIAIGVGGYASGPVIRRAARSGIPTLIQEQNSYAGVTNRLLAKKVKKICVAYKNMGRYFPQDKIIITGNPVRNLVISEKLKVESLKYFNLVDNKPVLLVIGGSLGARTINEAMLDGIEKLNKSGIQVIWQTGSFYSDSIQQKLSMIEHRNIHACAFITRMDLAYNVADLVISRAGAISISELCVTGRASILVPSPNVAEDHQTKNAMALVDEKAAEMIRDMDAKQQLVSKALELIEKPELCSILAANSKRLAKPDATSHIVDEVMKLLED